MGGHEEQHLKLAGPAGSSAGCQSALRNSSPPWRIRALGSIVCRVTEPVRENDRSYRGLNFFSASDKALMEALARGEFNLRGLQNKTLRAHLGEKTSGQISRLLKQLRLHGLIKKVGHTYRYYLTLLGKHVIAAGLKLKNLVLIPQLALVPSK